MAHGVVPGGDQKDQVLSFFCGASLSHKIRCKFAISADDF